MSGSLEFQLDSLELIRWSNGSQKAKRLALPPIGKPKYTKGTEPTLQLNTIAASVNQEVETLTPTNWLLEKFTF